MSQTKAQLLGPLVADNVDVNGDLNFDSGTLKLDPTNNRVGVNNANPTKTLDIGGDVQLADLYYTADYPTIRPTLDLAFAQTKQLDSRITFTRSSTGTYVGTDGLIKTAAVDAPRFDHDPVTGESLGLLIEESRTNDVSYSENFNTWWLTGAIGSVTANSTTSPDGNNTGTLLVNTSPSTFTVNGNTVWYGGQIYRSQFTGPTTGTRTWSLFAKSKECDIISIIANTSGGSKQAYFDLSNGTVYFEPSDTTCRIEPYPNGWYKCSVTWNQGSSVYYTYNIQVFSSTEITGSDGIYIWGAQLESGAFATSYIPTSGSTVTRSADVATITGTNFSSWYTPNQFTLYGEGRSITGGTDTSTSNYALVSIDDNTSSNRFILRKSADFYQNTNNQSGFTFRYLRSSINLNLDAFPPVYDSTGNLPDWLDSNIHKMAFAINNDSQVPHDIAGYGDGISADFSNTGDTYTGTEILTPYTAATQMQIGFGASSTYWNGHISRISYYPRRLNNSQLQNITL